MNYQKANRIINHATLKNDSRPVLTRPYHDVEKNKLVAADGFRMAIIDVDPLIDEFPDYARLIPSTYKVILEFDIADLLEVAQIMAAGAKGGVVRTYLEERRLMFETTTNLMLNAKDMATVSISMLCEVIEDAREDGEEVKAAISSQYLLDCARAMKLVSEDGNKTAFEKCTLQINTCTDPITFRMKDYIEVITPMFVNWEAK